MTMHLVQRGVPGVHFYEQQRRWRRKLRSMFNEIGCFSKGWDRFTTFRTLCRLSTLRAPKFGGQKVDTYAHLHASHAPSFLLTITLNRGALAGTGRQNKNNRPRRWIFESVSARSLDKRWGRKAAKPYIKDLNTTIIFVSFCCPPSDLGLITLPVPFVLHNQLRLRHRRPTQAQTRSRPPNGPRPTSEQFSSASTGPFPRTKAS